MLVDQLACLRIPMRDENIIMTLFENLLTSYEYLIRYLEIMPIEKLAMEFMMVRLMREMLKRKKIES